MRFSDLDGRSVGVWGAGREIRSLVEQLNRRLPDTRVTVLVSEGPEELPVPGLLTVRPDAAREALRSCDVIVRSPGVPLRHEHVQAVLPLGVPVTTATGLWMAERGGRRVIGITGTTGKSTTATITAHVAATAGHTVHLAGNIGRPALDLLDVPPEDWCVVELSSYQIADLMAGPQVALIVNLARDHTDWHGSLNVYRQDKLRMFGLPGVEVGIAPATDPSLVSAIAAAPHTDVYERDDRWHIGTDGIYRGDELRCAFSVLGLREPHNRVNLCGALTALEHAGLEVPDLATATADVPLLPHRLQTVRVVGGVEWVNDGSSKTPEATLAAMAAFPDRPLVLIAGGVDRGQDLRALAREVAQRDAAVIGLPTTGGPLVDLARAAGVPAGRALAVRDMAAAVGAARELAEDGAVVLLSPAAVSYGAYANFEARGAEFARLAEENTIQ